jgi:hypothetical protein
MTSPVVNAPAPSGLRRATINASIQGGEIMAHNIWYRQEPGTVVALSLQDHADKIAAAWDAMLNSVVNARNVASILHSTTVYTDVKLYSIAEGSGLTSDVAMATMPQTAKGNATDCLPSEVALAVTLETGQPGRTKRGRFFLGGFAAGVLEPLTGRAKFIHTDTISIKVAEFLQASRDQAGQVDDFRPVVYSRKTGTTLSITRASVGDVMDVQRRRRNAHVEVRTGQPVAA